MRQRRCPLDVYIYFLSVPHAVFMDSVDCMLGVVYHISVRALVARSTISGNARKPLKVGRER